MNTEDQHTHRPSLVHAGADEREHTPPSLPDATYCILGMVARHPDGIHGYGLTRERRPTASSGQSMGLGALYRQLERLHRAGLLRREAEVAATRLRNRFSITPRGEAVLRAWLSRPVTTSEGFLARLRFAHWLPRTTVLTMIDDVERQVSEDLSSLRRPAKPSAQAQQEEDDLWITAVEARLHAERQWLQALRELVNESTLDIAAVGPAAAAVGG
jgi:DNA-binding PadR family transcriptional regulator